MSLVNLSRLAWRTMSRDTSLHGTKGRLERARSTTLQGQDRHVPALLLLKMCDAGVFTGECEAGSSRAFRRVAFVL